MMGTPDNYKVVTATNAVTFLPEEQEPTTYGDIGELSGGGPAKAYV